MGGMSGGPPGATAPGTMAPAMPGPGDGGKPGKEQRGRVLAGLGLHVLTIALPILGPTSPEGAAVADAISKLGKTFAKPPADIGQSEMKFLNSQMYPTPQGSAMDSGPGIKQSLLSAGAQAGPPPSDGGAPPDPNAAPPA
jgi:hypothetical protein